MFYWLKKLKDKTSVKEREIASPRWGRAVG